MSCGTPLSRLDRWSIRRRAAWDRCLSAVSGHSSFVIDYSAKHIIFVYGDGTSKTFAGSNPLHLERFLSGAGYKRDSAARSLASTSRLELPTALCQDIPFTPLSMDERLAALELSLRAHSFLCDSLSVSTHSLGEAIRLCAPRLCDGYMSSLRAIAHNANLARHHDLLALPRDEQTRYLKLWLRHTFGAWSGVIGAKLRMWNAYDRGYERALQAWAVSEVKSILHYCFGILRDEASEARKQQDIKAAQDRLRDSHISKYDQALTALASCRCKSLLHFCFGAWKETSHKRILKAHKKKVRELNDEVRALQEQVVKLTFAEQMLKHSHDEQRWRSEMQVRAEEAEVRTSESRRTVDTACKQLRETLGLPPEP